MFGICGVDEACGPRSELSGVTATSFAARVEYRCGVGCPPGVVLVYIRSTVARRLNVVGTEALVAYQGFHPLTTDINLVAGVDAGAIWTADGTAL